MTFEKNNSKIFNIHADQHFIQSLAQGIINEVGDDALSLADYTIILPNQGNVKALKEAFTTLSKNDFSILPRIYTTQDFDNDEFSLKIAHNPISSKKLMDIPPAIPSLQRKLLLAKEILSVPSMTSSPEKAIRLGGELARFLDFTQKHGVELKNLGKLAPREFSKQWGKTRDFLKIMTERWPTVLEEQGMIDPQTRKNAVTEIQITHWQQIKTKRNIIMAGFTHASKTEQSLLSTIANLENGRIIFSGVDHNLDDESWNVIDEAHPQYGIKQLLESIPAERQNIQKWGINYTQHKRFRTPNVKATVTARRKLLSETMRPSKSADKWLKLKPAPSPSVKRSKDTSAEDHTIDIRALTGMDLVTCGTPQQEASIIALKMRENLETSDRTIALVTTDRSLARRVAARLKYWNINVEDSVGQSLADTPTGLWMQLTSAMAADSLSPVTLLSCLKHPYATLGLEPEEIKKNVQILEDYLLRGPRPEPGIEGLEKRLSTVFNNKSRKPSPKQEVEIKHLQEWLSSINNMAHPFLEKMQIGTHSFSSLLDKHIEFAEMMANEKAMDGTAKLWTGNSGSKAASFLVELRKYAPDLPEMTGQEYTGVISTLMQSVTVKSKTLSHSNLYILSPKEARLFKADTMIIGGLNENSWPSPVHEINWLSREMLQKIALPSPDLHLGKSAHDFSQLLSSPDVLMTRAERNGNTPTVASPFLTRLRMVLKKTKMLDNLESKSRLVDINNALNQPSKHKPILAPEPKPPKASRPKQLSVSNIEMLLRDPYSLYARQILRLFPREELDAEPSARERGNFVHEILDEFIDQYPDEMPKDSYDKILGIGKQVFKNRLDNPSVRAFWWPRFEYLAEWFVKEETARREYTKTLATEAHGKLEIETKNGKFTLTAIADRIDRMSDDLLSIIDYKTGSVPTKSSVMRGFSPQLTLEALIAEAGGFRHVDAGEVGSLEYWKMSGGKPPGKIIPIRDDVNKLEQEALEGLTKLIETFYNPKTPYLHSPRPRLAPRFNSYKHLSREEEWKHEPIKPKPKRNKPK